MGWGLKSDIDGVRDRMATLRWARDSNSTAQRALEGFGGAGLAFG